MKNSEIEKLDFEGWPLPNEYLLELGRVSVLWVSLENLLQLSIGKLMGFNKPGPIPFIILLHSSFPQKLDMLGALCEHHKPKYPNLENHKEVIANLRSAQSERNRLLHNVIHYDRDSGRTTIGKGSARGKFVTNVEELTITDIRRASVSIDQATVTLYHLIFKRDLGPLGERLKNLKNSAQNPPDQYS